jgi:beta-lactamase class A
MVASGGRCQTDLELVDAMVKIALSVCLLFSCPLPAIPQDSRSKVLEEIKGLERQYGGHLGVMAKNLETGETVGLNAAERFPTASAIKLPVMGAFFDLVDKRAIDPGVRVVLTQEDKKSGSGILQNLDAGANFSLMDVVRLMIVLSDNSATNLVLDRLAPTHEERMKKVNEFLVSRGLKNTRILNRLYSLPTKQQTPEAIRYGIGVSTPEDMVLLLEQLYSGKLLESASCERMLGILKQQFYGDMIPRLLPREGLKSFEVANKTGFVNESKVDVGLVISDRLKMAVAIFVDKNPDHRDIADNNALMLAARVSRALWNHFTGSTGYEQASAAPPDVDWNSIPGGRWAIYRSEAALFPHKSRERGLAASNGTVYPFHPHYDDNSVIVFVPQGFKETDEGSNVIVHFHGHMNDNLGVLEQYDMLQTLVSNRVNALLVLAQGPYRARDSSGGKIEDYGGFKALVEDVLSTMKREEIVKSTRLKNAIISAHSGGYRPAAFALERGGLPDRVSEVFLFDAFYAQQEYFANWLNRTRGRLHAAYTDHLAKEHRQFEESLAAEPRSRVRMEHTSLDHDKVIQGFFGTFLQRLDGGWRQ